MAGLEAANSRTTRPRRVYTIGGVNVGEDMPKTAKVIQTGNSQVVRLPKDFQLDVGEVEISREGEAIVLRPFAKNETPWQHLRAALELGFSADFMEQDRR